MPSRRHFLASAGLSGLTAVSGCLDGSSTAQLRYPGSEQPQTRWWPQVGFDQLGTNFNPMVAGPRAGVQERWAVEIGPFGRPPVVAEHLVFVPTGDGIRAIDVRSGEDQWTWDGGSESVHPASLAWHDGLLYVARGSGDGVVALETDTGDGVWSFSADENSCYDLVVEPDDDEPVVFTGDDRGTVYALDGTTGEVRWRQELFGVVTQVVTSFGTLYVGTEGGEVYALGPADGAGRWRRKLPGWVRALSADPSGVYASVFGGPTARLQSNRAGATDWSSDVWSTGGLVNAGNRIFTAGGTLTAVGHSDGEERWSGPETADCAPIAAGDTVYAATEDGIVAYDGSVSDDSLPVVGQDPKRWVQPVEGTAVGLAAADGALFVVTDNQGDGESVAYAFEEA
ncbi:PQQ-binding-like beta-propeller repeat protein [Haloarchaeobius sp. TZWWS8]|uniref:PQQ-binding-like beta-propeller repeat protein n=1 Tax=Haloarchaeobius sp. TZWWS8 TaxID=3446121 RepID=UPI003EC00822